MYYSLCKGVCYIYTPVGVINRVLIQSALFQIGIERHFFARSIPNVYAENAVFSNTFLTFMHIMIICVYTYVCYMYQYQSYKKIV